VTLAGGGQRSPLASSPPSLPVGVATAAAKAQKANACRRLCDAYLRLGRGKGGCRTVR